MRDEAREVAWDSQASVRLRRIEEQFQRGVARVISAPLGA
jgi:hypothetical protein